MKPPIGKGALLAKTHPITFLLILCDELQEWNREAHGIIDKKRTLAWEASVAITDKRLDITCITRLGALPDSFGAEKGALLNKLLRFDKVFDSGFSVGSESLDRLSALSASLKKDEIAPRPLMQNLEKLAMAIHTLYNKKRLERYPEKLLEYLCFAALPDSMKYSNLRQARGISEKRF
jgi:hypothetical protein